MNTMSQWRAHARTAMCIATVSVALSVTGCGRHNSAPPEGEAVVWIDQTFLVGRGAPLLDRAAAATVDALEPVLVDGGSAQVRLFGHNAGASGVTVVNEQIPGHAEIDGDARTVQLDGIRRKIASIVADALRGQSEDPAVAAALASLSPTTGSDVAGAVRQALAAASEVGVGKRHLTFISDGIVNVAGELVLRPGERPAPATVSRALRLPKAPSATDVAFRGIGGTPGMSPVRTEYLVRVWRAACGRLEARSCTVRPTLEGGGR